MTQVGIYIESKSEASPNPSGWIYLDLSLNDKTYYKLEAYFMYNKNYHNIGVVNI